MAFHFLIGSSAVSVSGPPEALQRTVQHILDKHAARFNVSFSSGITWGGGASVHAVAGVEERASGRQATLFTLYPLGSVTKTYTTVAALRLAEAGMLDLDAPVASLVDPFLTRTNKSTLASIFPNEPRMAQITMRQLLSMRSGMGDYDDQKMRAWSIDPANVGKDITPYDFLRQWTPKKLLFSPGNGSSYSSTGYDLAGLVLAAVSGANTWTDFDQKAAILPKGLSLPGVTFPLLGPCTKYPNVSHTYSPTLEASASPFWAQYAYQDLASESCLNGWTCGNIAATGGDLSKALYAVLSPNAPSPMLSPASVAQMQQFVPFSTGFAPGLLYGLGLMKGDFFPSAGVDKKYTTIIGHAGQDYGSGANLHYWNEALDFSISLLTNAAIGSNCSLPMTENRNFQALVGCEVYSAALAFLTDGTVSLACDADSSSAVHVAAKMASVLGRTARSPMPPLPPHAEDTVARSLADTLLGGGLRASPADPPLHCPSDPTKCSGASTSLSGADCYAWKSLHAATGGSASASGARGESWTVCQDKFDDPCSCPVVECTPGGTGISAIRLASAGLVGTLPLDANGTALLSKLPSLTTLDLSSNQLFGPVPSLPFGQYELCDISGNDFDCPLPPGASACHPGDQPENSCWPQFAELTTNCTVALFGLLQSPAYAEANKLFSNETSAILNQLFPTCTPEIMAKHTCHLDLDWKATPQGSLMIGALNATMRKLDPTAELCLLRSQWNQSFILGGLQPVSVELDIDQSSALPMPQACTGEDRLKLLAFFGSKPQCLKQGHTNCESAWSHEFATCSRP